ncbi:MAG: ferredoxin [Lachnospiraceae bacterium]|jgi:ferredoxin|nr:ferredoxin [Lachnospiraceae bacterium]
MKAYVDQDTCIGCGMCEGTAPDAFRMNDDGKAECYAEGDDASVQEAIDNCPVGAISQAE